MNKETALRAQRHVEAALTLVAAAAADNGGAEHEIVATYEPLVDLLLDALRGIEEIARSSPSHS